MDIALQLRTTRTLVLRMMSVFLAASLVAGCGGGDDDKNADTPKLRLINATADAASVDLTMEDTSANNGERRVASGVARDGLSDYADISAASYRLRLKRAGASSSLAVGSATVEAAKQYTTFAYGREGDYRLYAALDDESSPSAGKSKLRFFNGAPDAGSVDVYLTEPDASLADAVPTVSNLAGATMGFFNILDRGTYRLRVTGVNDKEDIRLDVPAFALTEGNRTTVVLQPGSGGVLVNVLVSQHQSTVSTVRNPFARARLVAGATGNATVSGAVGGTNLNINLRAPSIGAYTLIPAGSVEARITVNATTQLGGSIDIAPGGDYTVAVYGDASQPQWVLITDDNRPLIDSDRAKLRLVHLAHGVNAALTMVKDFVGVSGEVVYGTASGYSAVRSSTDARLEVTSPLSPSPLFLSEDVEIRGRSVLSVFMLNGGTAPQGILRKER
jgi:Domain of unknown function (DUF4397)